MKGQGQTILMCCLAILMCCLAKRWSRTWHFERQAQGPDLVIEGSQTTEMTNDDLPAQVGATPSVAKRKRGHASIHTDKT